MIVGGVARSNGFIRSLRSGIGILDHFDEGIYASAALAWAGNGHPPDWLPPYSPPIYPGLSAIAYHELGPSPAWLMAIAWLTGTVTILIAAILGRRWFGPGAGAMAAIFIAASGYQASLSMMALTDSTFLLAWLAGLGAIASWIGRPTILRSIGLGLAAGIAQNAKYNGWLLLAIAAIAVTVRWFLSLRGSVGKQPIGPILAGLIVAGVVAALIYLPWFLFVERHGGYAALIRHHSGYVQGWTAWGRNFALQLEQAQALDQGWSPWGILAAGIAFLATNRRDQSVGRENGRTSVLAAGTILAIYGIGKQFIPGISWGFGAILILQAVRDRTAGMLALATTWSLMTLLTPLYHPYTRLWLPITALEWFAVAAALQMAREGKGGEIRLGLILALLTASLACGIRAWNGSPPLMTASIARPVYRTVDGIGRPIILALGRLGVNDRSGPIAIVGRPTLLMALAGASFPVERLPDLGALERGTTSATMAIADSLVIGNLDGEGGAPRNLPGWSIMERVEVPISTVTAFDQDPGLATNASRPLASYFWILRRAEAKPLP